MPEKLVQQLKEGGRMVIPVGNEMYVLTKEKDGVKKRLMGYYAFVPLLKGVEK